MGRRQAESKAWGHPGRKPSWHSALIAASVLSSCCLPSQAARKFLTVVSDPETPTEGGNVTLIPQGGINDSLACRWYRGRAADANIILVDFGPPVNGRTTGAFFTNRENVLRPLCSLHVTNLTIYDSATYIVSLEKPGLSELGRVDLEVLGVPPARGSESGGLSKRVIAAIVVSCLVVVMVIAGALYFRSTRVSH